MLIMDAITQLWLLCTRIYFTVHIAIILESASLQWGIRAGYSSGLIE
jgi:hypothetical protein